MWWCFVPTYGCGEHTLALVVIGGLMVAWLVGRFGGWGSGVFGRVIGWCVEWVFSRGVR